MENNAVKNIPNINGGTLISDLKSLFFIFKTRRTVVFVYGFMLAFVAFTVFLAFSPSPNSASPWFTNIFSSSSTTTNSDSDRSHFSSVFSYFFPNNTSPQTTNTYRSTNTTFQSPSPNKELQNHTQTTLVSDKGKVPNSNQTSTTFQSPSPSKEFQNHTQTTLVSDKGKVPSPNQANTPFQSPSPNEELQNHTQTTLVSDEGKVPNLNQTILVAPEPPVAEANHATTVPVNSVPSVNKEPTFVNNQTQSVENSDKGKVFNTNQTSISAPAKAPVAKNQSLSSLGSPRKSNSDEAGKSASLLKKQGNDSKSGVSVKKGGDSLVESLMNCDFFDGEWVRDDSYPLYKPGSCSLIDEQFNCILNGRPDKDYQKMKWKPKGCNLPRLDGSRLLDLLRGKRLVFVGDSLNRNMWESLVCILRNSVKDRSKVYEANGRHHFRGEASYSFIFKDYDCSVEFFVSPFLVQEWELPDKNGSKKETLRLDLVGRSSDQYKGADFIIFNTGHWWTHEKTSKGKDYYQEGSHVYGELNVLEAFRKALTTWARWVDANINPSKSQVFFRGYSDTHFSGGQWNSGGQCDHETQPIKNETYLRPYPPKMTVLEKVLKGMKTHVTYLNITRMTDFRKDGHPSIYRKQYLSKEERRSPLRFQDCSHWCLPGVPDAWNEVFYAELLIKQHKMQQHQRRP